MRRSVSCKRACGVGCVGVVVLAVLGAWAVHSLPTTMCDNHVLSKIPCPDGTLTAVVFQRGCGATDGGSKNVSVLRSGASLSNEGGNAFSLNWNGSVKVAWTSPRTLRITHDPRYYVGNAEDHVEVETGDGHKVPVSIHYTSEIRY